MFEQVRTAVEAAVPSLATHVLWVASVVLLFVIRSAIQSVESRASLLREEYVPQPKPTFTLYYPDAARFSNSLLQLQKQLGSSTQPQQQVAEYADHYH
jgi:hypothetical protein